jgi:pimeloyl-ACP methyl ester carboxylesterase
MRRWKRRLGFGLLAVSAAFVCYLAVGWFLVPTWVVIPGRQIAYWYEGVSSETVDVNGHDWPYLEAGPPSGRPMIMLHGFATSKDAVMIMMAPAAKKGFRVIAPDLPGFGEHAFHQGRTHDAAFYSKEIRDFMKAVDMPSAVLVGNSMGGALAAQVALDDPRCVKGLVLLSPAGVPAARRNSFMQAVDRGENPFDIRDGKDFDRIVKTVFWNPPYVPGPVRAWLVDRAVRSRDNTLQIVKDMRPFLENGLDGRLQDLHVHTAVLYGERDAVTDPSMALVFSRDLPSGQVAVIRDAGHVSHYDNWPDVWKEMTLALDRMNY